MKKYEVKVFNSIPYLIDKNENGINLTKYSPETAKTMLDSLIDCRDCIDCSYCVNCALCKNCITCKDCYMCIYCDSCERCNNCKDCYWCELSNSLENCDNCISSSKSINCYGLNGETNKTETIENCEMNLDKVVCYDR